MKRDRRRSSKMNFEEDLQKKAKYEKEQGRLLRSSPWWKNCVASHPPCHYCGRNLLPQEVTMDHLVPLSRGGRSTRGNTVPACKGCNSLKKNQTPADMLLQQLRVQPQ